jgi:hypothetical protein
VNSLISVVTFGAIGAVVCTIMSASAAADESPFASHAAAEELQRVIAHQTRMPNFKSTGLVRADYLKLIAGNVGFWIRHQNQAGAIIDPHGNRERQYSTPAFALASALLVSEAGRNDLLDASTRAMSWATHSLATGKAAEGHGDFFVPMLIHARRVLKDRVAPQTLADWDKDLQSIVPEKVYNMRLKGMNWNIVSSSGELLRRQDGLVKPDQSDAQWAYLEDRMADHARQYFTDFGMYADPGVPMVYDLFARLWLDDMMASGAYEGKSSDTVRRFLRHGGLSTLLLVSPSGEWPTGGRSALHNWAEAAAVVICEIHSRQWSKAGHPEIAGAFKRVAHLSFQSMQRWQRPSGELWIIKNRHQPEKRFAFERYSHHSQYNLLPMAMLAMAYVHADDGIAESPAPAEIGGYVFDLREKFHKVVAAAGGYYVQIDTAADPHYNTTGLQRVHRSGVEFPPLSDTPVAGRGYGSGDGPGATISPGIQWKTRGGEADPWQSLGDARIADPKKRIDEQVGAVRKAELNVENVQPGSCAFAIEWTIVGTNAADQTIRERYDIGPLGVGCVSQIVGGVKPAATRVVMPALTFDGAEKTRIVTDKNQATILHRGTLLTWRVESASAGIKLDGPAAPAHNGLMQALAVDLADAAPGVKWRLILERGQRP